MIKFQVTVVVPFLNIVDINLFLSQNSEISPDNLLFVGPKDFTSFRELSGLNIINQESCGIYNAINTAIKKVATEYYVVVGTDDVVYPKSIEKCLSKDCREQIISGVVEVRGQLIRNHGLVFFKAHKALVSEHAVGTIIKKKLHDSHGMYCEKYHIAADALFLLRCHLAKVNFSRSDYLFGKYSGEGVSTRRHSLAQIELALAMVSTFPLESIPFSILAFFRIIRKYVSNLTIAIARHKKKMHKVIGIK